MVKPTNQRERVFRVSAKLFWLAPALLLLSAILPILSNHEFATSGTIDLDALGKGRLRISTWILYSVSWLCFFYFLPFFWWWLTYVLRGHVFRLGADYLAIGHRRYDLSEIEEVRWRWNGLKVTMVDGRKLLLHPRFSHDGLEALRTKLGEKFPN